MTGTRVDDAERDVDSIVSGIGPRLRELRLQNGLSLQQLSERAGVSAAAIHKIERNGMVPTITTLLKLADAFDRPVAYFVGEMGSPTGPIAFTRASARPRVRSAQPGVDVRSISGAHARFSLAGTVTTAKPGSGSCAPVSSVAKEVLVLVLEGTLKFDVEGDEYLLRTGDAIHLRTGRPHRWENPGPDRVRAAWITLREALCP